MLPKFARRRLRSRFTISVFTPLYSFMSAALLAAPFLAASGGVAVRGRLSQPAAQLLPAALLIPAGAAFRLPAHEPAPAGVTPWDEAEGRRLANEAQSCDGGALPGAARNSGCDAGSCDVNCDGFSCSCNLPSYYCERDYYLTQSCDESGQT